MDDSDLKSDAPEGLKSLRELQVQPSPFLANRVEKNFDALIAAPAGARHSSTPWVRWSAVAAALILVALAGFWQMDHFRHIDAGGGFQIGRPYLVRMDIREIPRDQIAYAEISLSGENIAFASEKFKEIQNEKKITVSAEGFADKEYLPVAVAGTSRGAAAVTVNFYSFDHHLIATRTLDLNFEAAKI